MKKFLLGAASALVGIAGAVLLHGSFMLIEIEGSDMLPALEPGRKALVFLLTDEEKIKEGDLIACRPPFFQIGGGHGPLVRRVESIEDGELVLSSDASLDGDDELTIAAGDVLGKVVTF